MNYYEIGKQALIETIMEMRSELFETYNKERAYIAYQFSEAEELIKEYGVLYDLYYNKGDEQ